MNSSTTKGSRNYYGEYSLKQWIKFILTKEIVLPRYQRVFIWTEEDVRDLINSLQNGLFVPPITIGNYGGTTNYILDGQQRLSAILIAYIGLFPNKENFQFLDPGYKDTANDNDDQKDENEDVPPLEWQFSYFTEVGWDKQTILKKIDKSRYKNLDLGLDDNFWKDSYIGFSLIIPKSDEKTEQQKLYTSVFRNINIKGRSLSQIESRKSLYFQRKGFNEWFSPPFAYDITINNAPIDFVRYLSLLSQYKNEGNTRELAQKYKTKMEQYYESYILAEVNNEDESIFSRLLGSKDCNPSRYDKLKACIENKDFPKTFSSIIDADIYLFGLIYFTIAEGKVVSIIGDLRQKLEGKIGELKKDKTHIKSPSNLTYLRQRVQASIDIYRYLLTNQTNKSNNEA